MERKFEIGDKVVILPIRKLGRITDRYERLRSRGPSTDLDIVYSVEVDTTTKSSAGIPVTMTMHNQPEKDLIEDTEINRLLYL